MNIKTAFEISADIVEVKNLKVGDKIKVLQEEGTSVNVNLGIVTDITKFTSNDEGDGTVAVQMLVITSDYWRPAKFSVVTITEKNQGQFQIRPLDSSTEETLVSSIERDINRAIKTKKEELFELESHLNKMKELKFIKAS